MVKRRISNRDILDRSLIFDRLRRGLTGTGRRQFPHAQVYPFHILVSGKISFFIISDVMSLVVALYAIKVFP